MAILPVYALQQNYILTAASGADLFVTKKSIPALAPNDLTDDEKTEFSNRAYQIIDEVHKRPKLEEFDETVDLNSSEPAWKKTYGEYSGGVSKNTDGILFGLLGYRSSLSSPGHCSTILSYLWHVKRNLDDSTLLAKTDAMTSARHLNYAIANLKNVSGLIEEARKSIIKFNTQTGSDKNLQKLGADTLTFLSQLSKDTQALRDDLQTAMKNHGINVQDGIFASATPVK